MTKSASNATLKATLIMVTSMLLSRGIGFLRVAVLASEAGTGTDADAYAFAFLLPDLLNQFLAGGVLTVTFIPLFQSLSNNPKEQNRFFSNLFGTGTAVFAIGITLSYIFTPQILTVLAGDNIRQSNVFELTVGLTRIILPAQLFFFWGALLNGAQFANKNFAFPSLTPIIYNAGIIAGGVFLMPYIGIEGFAWGVVAGAFIGNVLVQSFGAYKTGVRLHLLVDYKDPLLKEWLYSTIPLRLTVGLAYSNELMGRIFGSRSPEGAGALASLNYAYRVFMIFVGLFGQAFASAIYPFLSEMGLKKEYGAMEKSVFSTLEKTAILTTLAMAMLFVVRYDVIVLLFQRNSFTAESTALTATALAAYIPGMFFFSAVLLLNRLFWGLKQTGTTLIISLLTLVITIPLYSTIGIKLGILGIALMGSLAAAINFTLLLFRWKMVYKESLVLPFLMRVSQIAFVSLGAGFLAWFIQSHLHSTAETALYRMIRVTLSTTPPTLLAFYLFQKLGFFDITPFIAKIKQKLPF